MTILHNTVLVRGEVQACTSIYQDRILMQNIL